jgi:hypothetical protein
MMHKVQSKNLKFCKNVDVTRRTESPKGLYFRGEVRKGWDRRHNLAVHHGFGENRRSTQLGPARRPQRDLVRSR